MPKKGKRVIKITVEEIEILITTRVEDEVEKNIPKIKKMVNQIKQEFEKIDTQTITSKTQQAVQKVNQTINQIKGNNADKSLQSSFQKAGTCIDKYQQQYIKRTQSTIAQEQLLIHTIKEKQDLLSNYIAKEDPDVSQKYVQAKKSGIEPNILSQKDVLKINADIEKLQNKLYKMQKIKVKVDTSEAKREILGFRGTVEDEKYIINIGTRKINFKPLIEDVKNFKNTLSGAKEESKVLIQKLKNTSIEKLKNGISSIKNNFKKINPQVKQMTSGIKFGIGQVLKYAGALFSLRGIYNVLSSSAQSWLSSQNAQAKQLSANIEYMKYAMGSAFASVIEYITNLVYKLMKAIQTVIYSLFKVNIFANASANSYANMADSAKKTAKETKTLSKIDEIDNIGGNDNDSSSGGGTTPPNFDLSSVDSSLLDWYKNLDFYELGKTVASKINTALSNIDWTEIQGGAKTIAQNIGNFINGCVDGFDWNLLGSTVGNGINTALIFANTLFTTTNFEKIGSSIATFLNSSISTINWKLLGTTIANEIKGIANTISGFFKTFDWSTIVDGLVDFITNFDWSGVSNSLFNMLGSACANLVNLGMVIGNYIAKAFTNIGQYFQDKIEECGGNIFAGIQKGITDAMIGIGKWIFDNIWIPFINGFKNAFGIHSPSTKMAEMGVYIIAGLKEGLKNIWENVKPIFVNLYNGIRDKFNEIKQKVYSIVNFLKDGVKDKFNSMKDKVFTSVNNLRNGVKDKFNSVKDKINTIVTSIKNGVTGKFQTVKNKAVSIFNNMKTSISNIFSGIWNTIKKVINSILGGIESMANGVVKGINRVIGALNNLNFKIPDWVPGGYGGKSFGLNLRTMNEISIPKLATGNVATEETLAIFGEYSNARTNPEITAPQSIIYETTKQALIDSNFSNNKNDNNSMPKTIVIKFGSYRVAFELEELIRKARRQNGTATVTI